MSLRRLMLPNRSGEHGMKNLSFGCRTMRDGAIVAAVFLVTALAMLIVGGFLVPDIRIVRLIVDGLGLLLLLLATVIPISTYRHTSGNGE
jgi:hypothetical protein